MLRNGCVNWRCSCSIIADFNFYVCFLEYCTAYFWTQELRPIRSVSKGEIIVFPIKHYNCLSCFAVLYMFIYAILILMAFRLHSLSIH